jgi:LPXTG-motif cell wall-anchored protein
MKIVTYSAATYSCNAYGAGAYNNNATCSTGGGLANTGADFWVPMVIGAVLFLGGITLLIRRMIRATK